MNKELDIAIVGGGVSGVYSAWRLQQELGDTHRIGLFEYSDRIGGRLYSRTLPGLPNVVAELGGMRFIPDDHVMVSTLVDELKLQTKDFPMAQSCRYTLQMQKAPLKQVVKTTSFTCEGNILDIVISPSVQIKSHTSLKKQSEAMDRKIFKLKS